MKALDETYADQDFQREMEAARSGWMAQVPRAQEPDLNVQGLSVTLIARLLRALTRQGR
jgi:hypothetical protein